MRLTGVTRTPLAPLPPGGIFAASQPGVSLCNGRTIMDVMSLLIQLVSGGVGGNVGGLLNKARSLGPMLNTVLGAVGGVAGGQLLGGSLGNMMGGGTAGNVGTSALVGLLLPLIASFFKPKKTA